MAEITTPIRLGMIGGGRGAFVAGVHRSAATRDGAFRLVAGALSASREKALASARELHLDRGYGTWQEMLEAELAMPESERVQAVSVVTPNDLHHPVCRAFADAGFHVVCDKPLSNSPGQAEDLVRVAAERGIVFAVTYNYTGYHMVREARRLVHEGLIGEVRKVVVTYDMCWEPEDPRVDGLLPRFAWRADPARSGPGGAVADMGSHEENLAAFVTGLELEAVSAQLTPVTPGARLDDDANVLLRFAGGATGVMVANRASVGSDNDLRLKVFGEDGTLSWSFVEPDGLLHADREGSRWLGDAGTSRSTEALFAAFASAFANVYAAVADAIRGDPSATYPTVEEGARGVAFIEASVESARLDGAWTAVAAPRK